MIKRDEIAAADSCLNRAADDEILFVLRGKDIASAETIRYWTKLRIALNKNNSIDTQIQEALETARQLDDLHGTQVLYVGNSTSTNASVASKFPDPAACIERLGVSSDALQVLKSFQHDTIVGLADCMITAAREMEQKNKPLDWQEMKRNARILYDYAETLLPAGPGQEATR